jgi:hypothetical protein
MIILAAYLWKEGVAAQKVSHKHTSFLSCLNAK